MVKCFDFSTTPLSSSPTSPMGKFFKDRKSLLFQDLHSVEKSQKGFSLLELLLVLSIMSILSAIALLSILSKDKYPADDQTYIIFDVLQEARLKAITQRTVFRFEIDNSNKTIWLVDENDPTSDSDDEVVKKVIYKSGVNIGIKPNNVTGLPTASSPVPVIPFSTSQFLLTSNKQTIALRFDKLGQVLDKGTNSKGNGALVTGATIFVSETLDAAGKAKIIRALTVNGVSGNSSILKCQLNAQQECKTWVR